MQSGNPMMQQIKNNKYFIFLGGVFLFFFLIMLAAPLSMDDFEFAAYSHGSFTDALDFCLTYGNGRIIGNLAVIYLLKSRIIAALMKAMSFTVIVALLPQVLGIRKFYAYPLSFLLLCSTDPEVFAQIYTWTCGFQNYIPPIIYTLILFWSVQIYSEKLSSHAVKDLPQRFLGVKKILICGFLFFLGICSQLFVEHSSLILCATAFCIVCKSIHDPQHKGLLPSLISFTALVIGLFLMVWIPRAFSTPGNHADTYRNLYLTSIGQIIFCCARNLLRLTNQYFGLSGLPLCLGAAITVHLTKSYRSPKANKIMIDIPVVSGISMVLFSLMDFNQWYSEIAIIYHGIACVDVLIILSIWVLALLQIKDSQFKFRILTLLGLSAFAIAPLLIIMPLSPRLIYHSYIFQIMAFMLTLDRYLEQYPLHVRERVYSVISKGVFVYAVCLGITFASIGMIVSARETYAAKALANGANEIDFFSIPCDYVYDDIGSLNTLYYFKDVPGDVTINEVPFMVWKQQHFSR